MRKAVGPFPVADFSELIKGMDVAQRVCNVEIF
jgi:hypothetical protein